MANLISRVREISKRIRDLEGLRATEDEANQFKTRADELSTLSGQVQLPASRIELFRRKGIAVETSKSHAHQLKLELEAMRQAYAADRKSIIAASSEWRFSTKRGLEGIARSSSQQLLGAWKSHLAEERPATDNGLLRLLSKSTAFQAQSRRIADLTAEFDRLANRLPSNLEELERPTRLAEELQALTRDIPDDIPEPVRRLFQFMEQGNATAEQLTGDAMQWLLDNKMLADVRVSWRSN